MMNLSIWWIGIIFIAGFILILQHFKIDVESDDWSMILLYISWNIFCLGKIILDFE